MKFSDGIICNITHPIVRMAGNTVASHDSAKSQYDHMWSDQWANTHVGGPMTRTRYRLVLRELKLTPSTNLRLLDVGAGNGAFMSAAVRVAPALQVYGAEFSSVAISQVHPSIRDRVATCDLQGKEALPWGGGFSVATCQEVLEHLEHDALALAHIRDALAPRGTLVVTVPAWRSRFGPQDRAAGHVRRYDPNDMRTLLITGGFKVVTLYCWGGPVAWAYLRATDRVGPERVMKIKPGKLSGFAANCIFQALKIDDHLTFSRGDQLIAIAERL